MDLRLSTSEDDVKLLQAERFSARSGTPSPRGSACQRSAFMQINCQRRQKCSLTIAKP